MESLVEFWLIFDGKHTFDGKRLKVSVLITAAIVFCIVKLNDTFEHVSAIRF